jgi:hypothetical protein
MKTVRSIFIILAAVTLASLYGCASVDPYQDDQEYSNMPWNTPQQWEGSRQIPGLSPGY